MYFSSPMSGNMSGGNASGNSGNSGNSSDGGTRSYTDGTTTEAAEDMKKE